ncbi:MAG: hypothetical protein ACRDPD_28395 [Streptosporangiaceae bacterium]
MSVVTVSRADKRREVVAWVLIVLLFTVGGFLLWYRAIYNVFPGQSADARVHWCGRDYDMDSIPAQSLRAPDIAQ